MKQFSTFICCLVLLFSISCANTSPAQKFSLEFRGADISYLPELESKEAGVNWIRLRLWTTNDDLEAKIALAKRIKKADFNFLLDLHYSDTWADPAHQEIPSSWGTADENNIISLCQKVSDYIEEVLTAFQNAGCTPDMIQTGNEITNGMLWPIGSLENGDFTNLATLLNSASTVIRQKSPQTKIMLHIEKKYPQIEFTLTN